jgi:hypothetical protein
MSLAGGVKIKIIFQNGSVVPIKRPLPAQVSKTPVPQADEGLA